VGSVDRRSDVPQGRWMRRVRWLACAASPGLTASTLPQIGPPHPPDSILGGPTAPIPKRSVAPASDISKLRSTEERLKCLTPNAPTEKPASAVSTMRFP
jgi:hypothetical protein